MSEISEEATISQEEIAIEQVVGFVQRFDEAHFHLACHAAFPLALTPDLLYQIWARFVDYAPWTAVAHLLLSQLCREVGHELYEMTASVRNVLLTELKEDKRFGKRRIEELADFLTGYVIQQLEGDNPNEQDLAQAQQWTALAYLNPGKATRELAEALQFSLQRQNITEAFRLASLIETFPSVLSDLGFSALLVNYASGIKKFACGNQQDAVETFLKLPIQNKKIEIAGVSLEIPEEIHLPSVKPNFLIQLLQLIATSDGNPEIVYPFLQENLGQLNTELVNSLRNWTASTALLLQQIQPQELAALVTVFSNLLRDFPLGSRAMNLEIAIAGYEISLSVITREAFSTQWANTQNNLAIAYRDRIRGERAENLEVAISCFYRVLQVFTRNEFPEQWANTQNNLAIAYRDRIRGERAENLEQAISYSQNALQVITREAFPIQWANTQNSLAAAYQERIRGERAENLEQAINCYQNALRVFTSDVSPEKYLTTQLNLALVFQESQNFYSAYNVLALTINTLESLQATVKALFKHEISAVKSPEVYTVMVAVCLQLGRFKEALEYVERSKSRNLVEQILHRNLYSIFPSEIAAQLEQYRSEITTAERQLQQGRAEDLTALVQRLQQLRQHWNELINRYLSIGDRFKLEQFQQTLDNQTAIVEFYITKNNFLVFIFTQQTLEPIVWQSQSEDLDRLVSWTNEYLQSYRDEILDWNNHLSSHLHFLANILHIGEIIQQIPSECARLILIPHQVLHLLPLHALPISSQEEKGIYEILLIDRFPEGVSYIPSCQLLQLSHLQEHPFLHNLFAIQNPTQDLAYTDIEVEGIRSYFESAKVLAGKFATKEAIVSENLDTVNCIHFSCHSYFDLESPLNSALFLAEAKTEKIENKTRENGLLTLREIFNFDLRQCCLVTLSGSETGLINFTIDNDEYIGFPSAFLYAGSRSVVSSLWNVSDLSTAFLMIKFYENLQSHLSIVVALNQAQQWIRQLTGDALLQWLEEKRLPLNPTMRISILKEIKKARKEKPFENPYYWAAFYSVGW